MCRKCAAEHAATWPLKGGVGKCHRRAGKARWLWSMLYPEPAPVEHAGLLHLLAARGQRHKEVAVGVLVPVSVRGTLATQFALSHSSQSHVLHVQPFANRLMRACDHKSFASPQQTASEAPCTPCNAAVCGSKPRPHDAPCHTPTHQRAALADCSTQTGTPQAPL